MITDAKKLKSLETLINKVVNTESNRSVQWSNGDKVTLVDFEEVAGKGTDPSIIYWVVEINGDRRKVKSGNLFSGYLDVDNEEASFVPSSIIESAFINKIKTAEVTITTEKKTGFASAGAKLQEDGSLPEGFDIKFFSKNKGETLAYKTRDFEFVVSYK